MVQPLQKANQAGLPLLTVDTFIGDGDYLNGPVKFPLSFIASDNELGGEIACNALIDAIGGKGKIYIQNVKRGHFLPPMPAKTAARKWLPPTRISPW